MARDRLTAEYLFTRDSYVLRFFRRPSSASMNLPYPDVSKSRTTFSDNNPMMPNKVTRSVQRRRNIKAWISGAGIATHRDSAFDVSTRGMKLVSNLTYMMPDNFAIKFNSTSPNNGACPASASPGK
jgi:hypothetical protein